MTKHNTPVQPTKQLHYFALLIALILISSGCSSLGLFSSDEDAPSPTSTSSTPSDTTPQEPALANTSQRITHSSSETTSVSVKGAPKPETDEVVIMWQIPETPTDGFILKYGFNRKKLSEQRSLSVEDVEKYDDPQFGFVYRYTLKNIPLSKTVYVQLATQKDGKTTPFSEIFEASPE